VAYDRVKPTYFINKPLHVSSRLAAHHQEDQHVIRICDYFPVNSTYHSRRLVASLHCCDNPKSCITLFISGYVCLQSVDYYVLTAHCCQDQCFVYHCQVMSAGNYGVPRTPTFRCVMDRVFFWQQVYTAIYLYG